jgi:hypothetical protein
MINGCKLMWSFFGNDHGKSPHDGASAIIKRLIWHEQLNAHGEKLINAKKFVSFLCRELSYHLESSYMGKRKPFHRLLWHIKSTDVDCSSTTYACEAIEGTMKIHSICAMNKNCMT